MKLLLEMISFPTVPYRILVESVMPKTNIKILVLNIMNWRLGLFGSMNLHSSIPALNDLLSFENYAKQVALQTP